MKPHHHPHYDHDTFLLMIGSELITAAVVAFLKNVLNEKRGWGTLSVNHSHHHQIESSFSSGTLSSFDTFFFPLLSPSVLHSNSPLLLSSSRCVYYLFFLHSFIILSLFYPLYISIYCCVMYLSFPPSPFDTFPLVLFRPVLY